MSKYGMSEKVEAAAERLRQPLYGFENMQIVELSRGRCVTEIDLSKTCCHNPLGNVHGGFLFTLCDTVAGMVSATLEKVSVTLNSNISYIKGAKDGTLRVEAAAVHCGRKTIVDEIKIWDEDGDLVTSGVFTMFVLGELE